ncbi:MAG: methylmalonyl-CoA mutase [Bdellovibrionaceae bacterium]|nr:methylmalonyl-CoA mutase [Pseudobdellovibrionaceae bacterium]|tara:strand:+ start:175553 stop:177148 length:1596 start_codon:yes stop_codon:yes gene_type:complete
MKERKSKFLNSSQIELKNTYTPSDLPDQNFSDNLGDPGEYPFTRGVQPNMYRGRFWTMRQYAGFGSAKESNERYKMLMEKGTTGLSVAFDLPTQMGYDSDHIMSTGEVGKVGVAVSSIEDMEILFDGLPLGDISTSMTINSTAGILLALYIAVAKRRGIDPKKLRGTIQNDLLKEYIARGTYIYPPKPSLRLITDIFDYCSKEVPEWNTISISGYHIREAGSTAAQELAFTLANGMTYVQAAIDKGLDVNLFGKRLSFFFNVHNNFFEEVAKFRAARRMWAHIMKERFGATDPKAMKLRFHSQVAGSTLTAQQPENNIVRVAYQAMASVMGGTQSLHTNSMDEALGLPTEKSATIALRTQQILAEETGVPDVVDPLAGSYYVESLTNDLEKKALDLIERIETQGGVVTCIESGWIQSEIQNAAYQFQKNLEGGSEIVVGVNKYVLENEPPFETLKVSEAVANEQIARLKKFKSGRNADEVASELAKITDAAKSGANLMPHFVSAVEKHVTLGEISDALRGVFGKFQEKITL